MRNKKRELQNVNITHSLFVSKPENILKQAKCFFFFHTLKRTLKVPVVITYFEP